MNPQGFFPLEDGTLRAASIIVSIVSQAIFSVVNFRMLRRLRNSSIILPPSCKNMYPLHYHVEKWKSTKRKDDTNPDQCNSQL
jgi:hypothetical protein